MDLEGSNLLSRNQCQQGNILIHRFLNGTTVTAAGVTAQPEIGKFSCTVMVGTDVNDGYQRLVKPLFQAIKTKNANQLKSL
jgi:hypothetical protein